METETAPPMREGTSHITSSSLRWGGERLSESFLGVSGENEPQGYGDVDEDGETFANLFKGTTRLRESASTYKTNS